MNNAVFRNCGKCNENDRKCMKHRDIKLVATNKTRNLLVSEHNSKTSKCFSEKALAIEIAKSKVAMSKPSYLDFSILDIKKLRFMSFHMITSKKEMITRLNYVKYLLFIFFNRIIKLQ